MITFRVYGIPQTKGSTKAFNVKGRRFPVVTNDNTKNAGWAATVSGEAQRAARGLSAPYCGAIWMKLHFHLPRPKSLPKGVLYPISRPDLDKMIRSIKDALQGVIYLNDSQVVELTATKFYSYAPGVEIEVREVEE